MTARALRAARLNAGLTQARLAQLAGITPVTVARFESGRHTPHPLTVARLKTAFEQLREAREQARLQGGDLQNAGV